MEVGSEDILQHFLWEVGMKENEDAAITTRQAFPFPVKIVLTTAAWNWNGACWVAY